MFQAQTPAPIVKPAPAIIRPASMGTIRQKPVGCAAVVPKGMLLMAPNPQDSYRYAANWKPQGTEIYFYRCRENGKRSYFEFSHTVPKN